MNLYFERKRAALGELIYAGWTAGTIAGIFGVLLIVLRADGEWVWSPFARTAVGFFGPILTVDIYVGVLSGIVSGGLMTIFLSAASAMEGRGALAPVRMIAAAVYGDEALQRPTRFPILMTGMVIHFATASLFGLIWVAISRRSGYGAAVLGGAFYGLAIWMIQQYGLLPMIDQPLARGINPTAFAIAHLLFGAALGAATLFVRQVLDSYVPAVLVGLFSLFAVTEAAGMIFALIGGDWPIRRGLGWGALYGLLLWLIIHGAIYAVNPPLARSLQTLPFAAWNIFLGLVIGTYPAFLEVRTEEEVRREDLRRAA